MGGCSAESLTRSFAKLVRRLDGTGVPVIVSGGSRTARGARRAYLESEADAMMIARGSRGNPWIFGELTGRRLAPPARDEIVAELRWVLDRAGEHLGNRAAAYMRKFYPWYLQRLGLPRRANEPFQRTMSLGEARALLRALSAAA